MEFIKKISNLKNWQIFLLLFILGAIAYANIINGEFIWDEYPLLIDNEYIKSFKHIFTWFTENSLGSDVEANLYRPISTMLNAIVYAIFGLNEAAYHILNILLHIGNAFCVFILMERLKFARFGSLLAAILFLLHPIQTESVSYIAGLPDVLSPFFILLSLIFFIGKDDKPLDKKSIIAIIIFTILGMLSKETGVTTPALMGLVMIYLWRHYDKASQKNRIQIIAIVAIFSIIYATLRMTVLNFTGTLSLSDTGIYTENITYRTYTFFAAIVEYMKLIIYPAHLHFEKDFEIYSFMAPKPILGLGIIITTSFLAWFSYFKKKYLFFTYTWFAISIVLVSGIFIASNSTYKEHWLYIPMIGIVFLIPVLWEKLRGDLSKQIFLTAIGIILIVFTLQTIQRNTEWKTRLSFFSTEIKYNSTSSRVRNKLGIAYFDQKQYEKAIQYFEEGIVLDKDDMLPGIRVNLGNTYLAIRNLDAAVNQYFTALQQNPDFLEAHKQLHDVALATHNYALADKFQEFMDRILNGGSVDFEKEIAPLGAGGN